jgi:hypothetical protein
MTGLQMVWLDHNPSLGGVVPASLSQLANLTVLELHRSNFTGVLPALNYRRCPFLSLRACDLTKDGVAGGSKSSVGCEKRVSGVRKEGR